MIIERYYYIMFKIVRDYPESKLFTYAIDGILTLAHKIEAKMLASIVEALQDSQETMQEIMDDMAARESSKNKFFMNHPGFVALMKKRMATVFSSIEISSKASFLDEMEERVSLTCLYRLLQDIIKYKFSLNHFEPIRKVKFLTLLEKLFLAKKHLSADCLAAFVKLLADFAASNLVPDEPFRLAVMEFVYLAIHVDFNFTLEIPETQKYA